MSKLTQSEVAQHLGFGTTTAARNMLVRLKLDNKKQSLDEIRTAYIEHLRAQASGHRSEDGIDLTRERALTERVDRDLKTLQLEERTGTLVPVAEVEPMILQMITAARGELLAASDKLCLQINATYGIEVDQDLINGHIERALRHLASYTPHSEDDDREGVESVGAASEAIDDGVGE